MPHKIKVDVMQNLQFIIQNEKYVIIIKC
jgi:hypothetical protein